MDINKLTRGEQIISAAAIVYLISTFLPWFTLTASFAGISQSESANGWDVGFLWGRFPALLALVMLLAIVLPAFANVTLPELPVRWGQVHLGLGALAALLVILKLIIGEDGGAEGVDAAMLEELGFEISRAWGLFLAALAAVALAVGGFFRFTEDQAGVSGGTTAPPSTF